MSSPSESDSNTIENVNNSLEKVTTTENKVDRANRKRAGIKSSLTKRINQISESIKQGLCDTELRVRANQIKGKFIEAKDAHECLMSVMPKDDPRYSDDWIEDLEIAVDQCILEIEVYCTPKQENNSGTKVETHADPVKTHPKQHSSLTLEDQSSNRVTSLSLEDQRGKGVTQDKEDWEPMWRNLKKIALPTFSGDKRQYENWFAAFSAIIDKAPMSAEHKLLQLRQYLSGEAATVIDGLGHSSTAYEVAKEKLERRYGGERRRAALYLEEVDSFKTIRPNNSDDLQRFSDFLDILTISLSESNQAQELGAGLLYIKIQQKLPKNMLTAYHRWLFEKHETGSVITLRKWILQETDFDIIANETTKGVNSDSQAQRTFLGNVAQTDKSLKCVTSLCKLCCKNHNIELCPIILDMDVNQRSDIVYKLRLCFGCLGEGHTKKDCKRKITCGECGSNHNTLFHRHSPTTLHNNNQTQLLKNLTGRQDKVISLRTIPIRIQHEGKEMLVNALLDDGSTQTFINSDIAESLKLPKQKQTNISVGVLNGTTENFRTSSVDFAISTMDRKKSFKISAMTTDRVTGDLKPVDWKHHAEDFPHLKSIPFWKPNSGTIDILIGLDYAFLHQTVKEVYGGSNEPFARLTPLGWTCIGKTKVISKCMPNSRFVNTFFLDNKKDLNVLNNSLKKFWETEEFEVSDPRKQLSVENQEVMELLNKTIRRTDGNKRYQVPIPWKDNKKCLENNYDMALQRLTNTEKQLKKREQVKEGYQEVIKSYISKGYIRKVENFEKKDSKWFLPHFPVVKLDKITTKIRVVFDASAAYHGLSLNEAMKSGPNLQSDMSEILIRFRRKPIALICDISEMYLQIELAPEDKPFHRFLWRESDDQCEPTIYEFNRIVFGGTSSPFLAQFVSKKNAEFYQAKYPKAVETVLESTYMDDSMDSVEGDEAAVQLYHELKGLWDKAGMKTHKWLSNSPKVMELISNPGPVKSFTIGAIDILATKTLGVVWKPDEDCLSFDLKEDDIVKYTKRSFLKRVASVFDPLGFITPYVLSAKVLMQELWVQNIDWDVPIDGKIKSLMEEWCRDLQYLVEMKVPRCISPMYNTAINISLHVFTDASEDAYAVTIYARTQTATSCSCQLVISKCKVAPLHSTSVPRLELLAALKGSELSIKVSKSMQYDINKLCFWTDSRDVLAWIKSRSRAFKPFVAHKLGKIHSLNNPSQWRYVPSKLNPADIATHPSGLNDLINNKIWINGPEFLSKPKDEWPHDKSSLPEQHQLKEFKSKCGQSKDNKWNSTNDQITVVMFGNPNVMRDTLTDQANRLNPDKFSSWTRITRVTAWVARFIFNCKTAFDTRLKGELGVDEIDDAQFGLIQKAQLEKFTEEYLSLANKKSIPKQSKKLALSTRFDEDHGVLRCDGRIQQAEFLPYDVRYPIILPRNHPTTLLIVKHFHERAGHQGTNYTLSKVNNRYWIVAAREEIRKWEKQCFECRRRKIKTSTQLMAPLPKHRLNEKIRAFGNVGLDYAGPFLVKLGRGRTRTKRYLCLFTCLVTRAVHLEMAYKLDTNSFMNALWRMTSRRGLPKLIVSDNGKKIVGANAELKTLLEMVDMSKVQQESAQKGITWHFNPPYSPHTGGVFEIMIKAAKRAMKTFSNADLNDEELLTIIVSAEGLINSRPLTYQTANVNDIIPLTPNHFLIGQMGGEMAPEIDNTKMHPVRRWRRVQEILRHFWTRWIKEWLPSLNPRRKWQTTQRNIQTGDVVLILSQKSERGTWPLGKVTEVTTSNDGNVRSVKVLEDGKIIDRGLNSLCLIVPSDEISPSIYENHQ